MLRFLGALSEAEIRPWLSNHLSLIRARLGSSKGRSWMTMPQRTAACRILLQLIAEVGTLIPDQLVIEELAEVGAAVDQVSVCFLALSADSTVWRSRLIAH